MKINTIKKNLLSNRTAVIPPALLLCFTYIGFPGIAHHDTFHMYVEAANHTGQMWWSLPLEQLWSLFMMLGLVHIGWFYIISALLLGLGSLVILTQLGGSTFQKTIFGILFFLCPYLLIFLYQIYRINLSIGALVLSIGLALLYLNSSAKKLKCICCIASVCLLLLTAIARIDMLFACIPILYLFIHGRSFKAGVLLFFLAGSLYVAGVKSLYWFSKALYNKTNVTTHLGFAPSMHLDLIGISLLSGTNQYPETIQTTCDAALKDALAAYSENYQCPVHTWRNSKSSCHVNYSTLQAAWLQSISKHPFLYVKHRLHWSTVLLGLERRAKAYQLNSWHLDVTSGLAHEELSTRTTIRTLATTALYAISIEPFYASKYILWLEQWARDNQSHFFFKGYFYCLLHLLVIVILLVRRSFSLPAVAISSSGLLHLIAMSFLSPSFTYRYLGWFAFSGWIAFWLAALNLQLQRNIFPSTKQGKSEDSVQGYQTTN